MSKYEEAFLELDPALSSVEWVGENEPIEVHLSGEVDEESVDEFESNLRTAQMSQQEVIPVVINSTGGDVYSAAKIIDLLACCEQEIVTVVRGTAIAPRPRLLMRRSAHHRQFGRHAAQREPFNAGGTTAEMKLSPMRRIA